MSASELSDMASAGSRTSDVRRRLIVGQMNKNEQTVSPMDARHQKNEKDIAL